MPQQRRSSRPVTNDAAPNETLHPTAFQLRSLQAHEFRRTNDEIHSTITLDPVTCVLMDTPPFQRLRGLKQLGTAEYVYMNVNHNRFEHSLGVAALGERLCRKLQQGQPTLNCSGKDVLCVKLAGLFHDVGHGPYSHVFEEFVRVHLPAYLKQHTELEECYNNTSSQAQSNWKHETASLMMLDATLEHLGLQIDLNNLDAPLKQIGNGIDALSMKVFGSNSDTDQTGNETLTSRDFVFVKECINGGPIPDICRRLNQSDGFVGRMDPHKEWLYEIVNNQRCGLDVDKIDYYARDQRRAFREAGEIDKVMIEDAIVAWGHCTNGDSCARCFENGSPGKHLMICYPEKTIGATIEFFRKRFDLHSRLYQHKTHGAVSRMICDILCLADPYFRLARPPSDSSGVAESEGLPMSRAMLAAHTYVLLRDSVIDQIANTTTAELAPARRLIARLWARDLYKCIGTKVLNPSNTVDLQLWKTSESDIIHQILALGDGNGSLTLDEEDLFVHKIYIHCGQKDQNPLSKMRFCNMSQIKLPVTELPTAVEVEETAYEAIIPRSFMSNLVRIYCRDPYKLDQAQLVYYNWLDKMKKEESVAQVEECFYLDELSSPRMLTQDTNDDSDDESDDDSVNNKRADTASSVKFVTPVKRRYSDCSQL
jgi:HD superfamily phosphohydrolase